MKIRHRYLLLVLSAAILVSLLHCERQPPKVQELEWPPDFSTAISKAPTVAYCELIHNPSRFANQIIRTEAVFYKNLENEVFYDLACNGSRVWVEFDPAYVYTNEALKKDFDKVACLRQQRCDGRARVTVVGRFEGPNESGYGHLGCCPYRFSIMRLEKVESFFSANNSIIR